MTCPLCTGEPAPDPALEVPPRFIEARAFCARHGVTAELPGGARYADVARGGDPRLDGPATSHLLNPVSVAGSPAFALWGAGGFVVYEQVFPSADCFEHIVQHQSQHLEVLHHLHRDRARFGGGIDVATIVTSFAAAPDPSLFGRLDWLTLHATISAFVREHGEGRERTAAEAAALSAEMRPALGSPDPAAPLRAVARLLAIAERRFARRQRT